jgi:hypothetical protein
MCTRFGNCFGNRLGAWIALVAWLPLAASAAIPYVYPFNAMTGQEVIKDRLKEPKTQLDYINREKVDAYLNGIKDGGHGRAWCLTQPVLPQELNVAVVRRLKATLKPAELKENAAPLVLAELGRRFPCPKSGKNAVKEPVKHAVKQAVKKSDKKSETKPDKKPDKKAGEKSAQESGEKPRARVNG